MSSRETADLYDAHYYATGCGPAPYERTDGWLQFFDSVAEQIVGQIGPESVLDVGCGMGFLVECLRRRGVEAYGLDISSYAIEQVHPDMQPYCWLGSVTDPLPRKYDLIVCLEVLEHLPPTEAQDAVRNLCQSSDDILFSSTPFDYKEPTHFNVQLPEKWVEWFGRQGFVRDLDFEGTFITTWTIRFRKTNDSLVRTIGAYERRLWQLLQENHARRELCIEQRNELSAREFERTREKAENTAQIQLLEAQITYLEKVQRELEASPGWYLLQKMQHLRASLAPPKSVRDQCLSDLFQVWQTRSFRPLAEIFYRLGQDIRGRSRAAWWRARLRWRSTFRGREFAQGEVIHIAEVQACQAPVEDRPVSVEIVVCVHNALDDVKRCLQSIVHQTTAAYRLILVDDGSNLETRNYLAGFAGQHQGLLLRNEKATGYTFAANRGLRHTSADYVVLLNSDTIVTPGWLDRLINCARSEDHTGLVGPLSNTASWQSIPEIEFQGDWAMNPLPPGLSAPEMGELVARYSACLYPSIPFLNGFCLLIRRALLTEIGYFDEKNFGAGYGEENDYALRARKAGWQLRLADNAYVYHAQSRSYSDERRQRLSERANQVLTKKHGRRIVSEGVSICRHDRVLAGIRARSRAMLERQAWITKGKENFAGRRVLFILPVFRPGGGANVVIDEATAMQDMGVDVRIFNLTEFRQKFEYSYPDVDIPVHFGNIDHLSLLAGEYEAMIATFHASVGWLAPLESRNGPPVLGYYIQDFEPYMYPVDTEGYKAAWDSYTLVPNLVRFTKTEWNRQEVKIQTGAETAAVGASVNIDLFRPRPRSGPERPDRPLKIGAMVRADSPHRQPWLTMRLLQQATQAYGHSIEIMIFGTDIDDFNFSRLPYDFPWKLAGLLNQKQVARFLNEVDIFVDFSSHQAMGLTALEAMACGAAVIVPEKGGSVSFARSEENSLVVDTASEESCRQALSRLIEDQALRSRLQNQALVDACDFFPERPAFNILSSLFRPEKPPPG